MHESGENYLETILILEHKNGSVRSIDIANELQYTKPSISRAMGILRKNGFVKMEDNGQIVLTAMGRKKANEIYERHLVLTLYLARTLSIDETMAARDACKIEHVISSELFEKIKEFVQREENHEPEQ